MSAPVSLESTNPARAERRSTTWFALAILVISTGWLMLYAPLDPDPHHDGVQLAPAIAVSHGLTVQTDVFSQYGPLTVWLHALVLNVLAPNLVSLRIATAILLGISATLMFLIARQFQLPKMISAIAALLWVAMAPMWMVWPSTYHLWPWPSVTFLVLALASLLALLKSFEINRTRSLAAILTLVSGALVGLSIIARPNYGIVFAVALAIIVLARGAQSRERVRGAAILVLGTIVGASLPILELIREDALKAFVDQAIIGPLGIHPAGTSLSYNATTYLAGSIPLIMVIIFGIWLANKASSGTRLALVLALIVAAALAIGTLGVIGFPTNTFVLSRLSLYLPITIQSISPMYAAAVATIIALGLTVLRLIRRVGQPDLSWMLVLTGVAALVQLYPVADPMHLWWCAPLPILVLIQQCQRNVRGHRRSIEVIAALFVPFIALSIALTAIDLASPRTTLTSGALEGMRIRDKWMPHVGEIDAALSPLSPGETLFLCRDGLWSVWNSQYLATGPGFVDWSFGTDKLTDPAPKTVVLCAPNQDINAAQKVADGYGLEVTKEIGPIMMSEHTFSLWMYLLESSSP